MNQIENISPNFFALAILIAATLFTVAWFFDAITHSKVGESDVTKRELHTHRILIITSMLMEFSLVLMYWFSYEVLPLFIAALVTRTAHEFIDEIKFHVKRCSFYETMLHLSMWITVITKTVFMFLWGFYCHYKGLTNLHPALFIWGIAIVICMSFISLKEWNQKTIE
jgi:hypothetical protein